MKRKPRIEFDQELSEDGTKFYIKYNDEVIGWCWASQYDGCCGICILYGLKILKEYENKGYGQKLFAYVLRFLQDHNYTVIKLTTNHLTPNMHHIAKKFGFQKSLEFVNKKTDNTVTEYNKII